MAWARGPVLSADRGGLVFVAGALVIIMAMSVSGSAFATFPPRGFTCLVRQRTGRCRFSRLTRLQCLAAAGATAARFAFGLPAAFALTRCRRARPRGTARDAVIAVDFSGPGDRTRVVAAVVRLGLRQCAGQFADRPYSGDLALCRAHRLGQPVARRSVAGGRGPHAGRRPMAHLPPRHLAADRARHRRRRAVRLHGVVRQLSRLDVARRRAERADTDADLPADGERLHARRASHVHADDAVRARIGDWPWNAWSACAV